MAVFSGVTEPGAGVGEAGVVVLVAVPPNVWLVELPAGELSDEVGLTQADKSGNRRQAITIHPIVACLPDEKK